MADFDHNPRGGLTTNRESLHASAGYKRQVAALEQMRESEMDERMTPPVDCIGLALGLEQQAARIESQTAQRAMYAAATGLRRIDAHLAQPAQAVDVGTLVEAIASEWDGCEYEGVGERIDIGAAIRQKVRTIGNAQAEGWRDIATAPKGGGAEYVTDQNWVEPPRILLRFGEEGFNVAYWDWYYAEGGNGCTDGFAWIDPCSGDQLNLHFSTPPDGWMPLPTQPTQATPNAHE